MAVALDTVRFAADNDANFGMGFQSADPIDHMDSSLFQFASPLDIPRFVEAGLQSTIAVTYLPRSAASFKAATIGLWRLVR